MNALNETATAAFHWLVKGLPEGKFRDYPTPSDALEPVTVERLSEHRYLVGFYFEQNSDICADPEILLEVQGDQVVPLSFYSWTGLRSTDPEELVPYANELLPLMRSRVESATKREKDDGELDDRFDAVLKALRPSIADLTSKHDRPLIGRCLLRLVAEEAGKSFDLNDADVQRLAIHLEHHLVLFVPGGSQ